MSLPRFSQLSLLLLVPGLSSHLRAHSLYSKPLSWYLLVECPEAHIVFPSLQGPLLRWLKVNFSEAFIAWIHIKALRVFVESVLRCVAGMLGWAASLSLALLPFAFCGCILAIFPIPSKEPVGHVCPARQDSLFPTRLIHMLCLPHSPVYPT